MAWAGEPGRGRWWLMVGKHTTPKGGPPVVPASGDRRKLNRRRISRTVLAALSRSATLRLVIRSAAARGRMWLASPALDPARNAEEVITDMVIMLEDLTTERPPR